MRAQVLTPWTGSGIEADPFRPLLADDYSLEAWRDVTAGDNVKPEPNLFVVEIMCSVETMEAIEADTTYEVLWEAAE